jgi:hypothetical protein
MDIDFEKVDDAALALLFLMLQKEQFGSMVGGFAWKSLDWDVLDRLHEKGFIGDPKNKNKSVVFTAEGMRRSEELFRAMFAKG